MSECPIGITTDPVSWLIAADWLEEHGNNRESQAWRALAALINQQDERWATWKKLIIAFGIRLDLGFFGGPSVAAYIDLDWLRNREGLHPTISFAMFNPEYNASLSMQISFPSTPFPQIGDEWNLGEHARYYAEKLWALCGKIHSRLDEDEKLLTRKA